MISFGLVAIPVGLAAATESRSISFRQVHRSDGARVRHERVCTVEDRRVEWEEIAKGYELPDGRMVVLTEDELAELPLPSAHTIEVAEFVPTGAVDPILFDRSYFLQPHQVALSAYSLLRDAMTDTGHVGLGPPASPLISTMTRPQAGRKTRPPSSGPASRHQRHDPQQLAARRSG